MNRLTGSILAAFFLVLNIIFVQCAELTFELEDNARQCFFELIEKDAKGVLEFQVSRALHLVWFVSKLLFSANWRCGLLRVDFKVLVSRFNTLTHCVGFFFICKDTVCGLFQYYCLVYQMVFIIYWPDSLNIECFQKL